MCRTLAEGTTLEYVKMKAFRWSLTGPALKWLEGLKAKSLTTWAQVEQEFLNKFFPPAKTAHLRQKITAFKQKQGEPLAKAWERYKELLRSCPTHGQPPYIIQEIFFNSLDQVTKDRINNYTRYEYLTMPPSDAWGVLEKLTTYDNKYGSTATYEENPYARPAPSMPLYDPPKEIDPDVREQYYRDQNKKLIKQVKYLSVNQPCIECGSHRHTTTECPHTEQVRLAEHHEEAAYAGVPIATWGTKGFSNHNGTKVPLGTPRPTELQDIQKETRKRMIHRLS